jgi:hypothetical protein
VDAYATGYDRINDRVLKQTKLLTDMMSDENRIASNTNT